MPTPASPWDEHASEWDDDRGARAYSAAAHQSLVTVLTNRGFALNGATICDFGCGTGLLTEQLADHAHRIDAVDTSSAMLAVLTRKIKQLRLANVHPATTLPTTTGAHDLVVCSSVLGFVPDYPGATQQLTALLRPEGLFVQWDWERDNTQPEPHGLSREEVTNSLAAAGLVSIEVGSAFEISVDDSIMRPLIGVGQKPPAATC